MSDMSHYVLLNKIEKELISKIKQYEEYAMHTHNKSGKTKQRAKMLALSEFLGWFRNEFKV